MAVARTGKFAAVSAIVIGGNEEHGVRINRLAIKGQVLNPLCIGINHLALAVITGDKKLDIRFETSPSDKAAAFIKEKVQYPMNKVATDDIGFAIYKVDLSKKTLLFRPINHQSHPAFIGGCDAGASYPPYKS